MQCGHAAHPRQVRVQAAVHKEPADLRVPAARGAAERRPPSLVRQGTVGFLRHQAHALAEVALSASLVQLGLGTDNVEPLFPAPIVVVGGNIC